jgi:pimeloyl-ACP methyl ester carboxylesterase
MAAFVEAVVRPANPRQVVVAGNSLGGFTALYLSATRPDIVCGCILLNAAGRFRPDSEEALAAAAAAAAAAEQEPSWLDGLKAAFQRFVIGVSFIVTKQPARIEQVCYSYYHSCPYSTILKIAPTQLLLLMLLLLLLLLLLLQLNHSYNHTGPSASIPRGSNQRGR